MSLTNNGGWGDSPTIPGRQEATEDGPKLLKSELVQVWLGRLLSMEGDGAPETAQKLLKINGWNLYNDPVEKENHLNQTSMFGFKMFIFQGVCL